MGIYSNYLICASNLGTIYILNIKKNSILKEIKFSKAITNISILNSDNLFYLTC